MITVFGGGGPESGPVAPQTTIMPRGQGPRSWIRNRQCAAHDRGMFLAELPKRQSGVIKPAAGTRGGAEKPAITRKAKAGNVRTGLWCQLNKIGCAAHGPGGVRPGHGTCHRLDEVRSCLISAILASQETSGETDISVHRALSLRGLVFVGPYLYLRRAVVPLVTTFAWTAGSQVAALEGQPREPEHQGDPDA